MEASTAYEVGGAGCEQTNLNKLRGSKRATKEEACADGRDAHAVEQEDIAQAARNAGATEQGAWIAYAQGRAAAAQAALLLLAFAAAVWGAIEARSAAEAIRDQVGLARDEFDASHRPWMAVRDVNPRIGIAFYHGNGSIPLELVVENVGTSPAADLTVNARVVPASKLWNTQALIHEMEIEIDGWKQSPIADIVPAAVIFPGEKEFFDREFMFDTTDWVHVPPESDKVLFEPMVIGAVFYRSTFGPARLYTTFIYRVVVEGGALIEPDHMGRVPTIPPPQNIHMQRHPSGWIAT